MQEHGKGGSAASAFQAFLGCASSSLGEVDDMYRRGQDTKWDTWDLDPLDGNTTAIAHERHVDPTDWAVGSSSTWKPGRRWLPAEELVHLRAEESAARACGTPWQQRGPLEGKPGFWRGQPLRVNSGKYAKRGGANKAYFAAKYGAGTFEAYTDKYMGKTDKGKGKDKTDKDKGEGKDKTDTVREDGYESWDV
jgi:hypothetical protein